jgi:xylulokinase
MTTETKPVLLGLDVGTSGVRAVAVTPAGQLLGEANQKIQRDHRAPGGIHEQDPDEWWEALCFVLRAIVKSLNEPLAHAQWQGVAVTSTSGSLVVADSEGRPLRPAILYDDGRGVEIAQELNQQAGAPGTPLGPSFSLVKAAWVAREEPSVWERTRHLLHPADWLCGKLSGEFGVSDFTNALKLGYDPESGAWNAGVRAARLPAERLPAVRRPGEQVGEVSCEAASETGLPAGLPVLAGATDGMASVIASGASRVGDANTTLGTTLVWKVLHDGKPAARGGIYFHLHPGGWWVPGAASNTGLGSVEAPAGAASREELDRLASRYFPTPVVCYRLSGQGERFPFANPKAAPFRDGQPRDAEEWYAAQLQSIAFVERWGYEILASCAIPVGDRVFSTGAAAASPVLSQLRADVLGRRVLQTRHPSAAFGAAILAAAGTVFGGDVLHAIESMTSVLESYSPSGDLAAAFNDIYHSFREACARRGYAA